MPALGRHALFVILGISFLATSIVVIQDFLSGGNSWKQGDWLINNASGPVRRGPFGSMILAISDLLGVGPLAVVCTIQVLVLAVLFAAFRRLVAQAGSVRVQALLLLSPALFTVFWVADPQGAVRKELLAFAGLALIGLGAVRVNLAALWLGVAVFCISALAHEAMVLFVPTLLAVLFLSGLHRAAPGHAMAAGLFAVCLSAGALLFALTHTRVDDAGAVCAPLLERGLDEGICDGAIRWLTYDGKAGVQAVSARLTGRSMILFAVGLLAALAPFACLVWLSVQRRMGIALLTLAVLSFLPLYPVAVDWGRWLSLQAFSIALLLACAMASGVYPLRRLPSPRLVLGLVGLALLVSPRHTIGATGFAVDTVKDIVQLFG